MSKNKKGTSTELDQVQQITECLFALNRSVKLLKNAIQDFHIDNTRQTTSSTESAHDIQSDIDELEKLLPKPTVH